MFDTTNEIKNLNENKDYICSLNKKKEESPRTIKIEQTNKINSDNENDTLVNNDLSSIPINFDYIIEKENQSFINSSNSKSNDENHLLQKNYNDKNDNYNFIRNQNSIESKISSNNEPHNYPINNFNVSDSNYIDSLDTNIYNDDFQLRRTNTPYPNILSNLPINFKNYNDEDNFNDVFIEKDINIILEKNKKDAILDIKNEGNIRFYNIIENDLKIKTSTESNSSNKSVFNKSDLLVKQNSSDSLSDNNQYYLVEKILKFIQNKYPLNHVLCGYYFKIFCSLSKLKITQVNRFFIIFIPNIILK